MEMPTTLNGSTLNSEIRSLIADAVSLPADDIVYTRGDIRMVHHRASRIKNEHVLVFRYGVLFRSRYVKGRWQATEQVCGTI